MFATLALASAFAVQATAAQTPAAAPAKIAPMSVQVEAAAKADAGVQAWVKELRAALEARKDEFRLAKKGETPELVVRIDSVGKRPERPAGPERRLPHGQELAPVQPELPRRAAQAEILARNLRKYADQMKAAPASRWRGLPRAGSSPSCRPTRSSRRACGAPTPRPVAVGLVREGDVAGVPPLPRSAW